jgi:lysophospholipase L1-like esterase
LILLMSTMKSILILCTLALSSVSGFAAPKPKAGALDLSKLVVVGDSLSAGVQNFSLLDSQQPFGYANVVAQQAGATLVLPLIPAPGAPNVLHLNNPGPPPDITPELGSLPLIPRDNPNQLPTNVAVPGVTVGQALTLRPNPNAAPDDAVAGWANLVLGFPNPFYSKLPIAQTQIEQAVALNPTTIIEWLGNNDALVPALFGQLNLLTPVDQFAANYKQVLDTLSETGAKIITANVPDVTVVPYFTSPATIAAQSGVSIQEVEQRLGMSANDYIRPSAQPYVEAILNGQGSGPLPATCEPPLAGLPEVPCVLKASDAAKIRSAIACYNLIIASETAAHGGVMVDIHAWADQLYKKGYKIKSQELTTDFLGGIFSLDGIHPDNTGYAIIANQFIDAMNKAFKTKIPEADVAAIAAVDPLVVPSTPGRKPHSGHSSPPPVNLNDCSIPQTSAKVQTSTIP